MAEGIKAATTTDGAALAKAHEEGHIKVLTGDPEYGTTVYPRVHCTGRWSPYQPGILTSTLALSGRRASVIGRLFPSQWPSNFFR